MVRKEEDNNNPGVVNGTYVHDDEDNKVAAKPPPYSPSANGEVNSVDVAPPVAFDDGMKPVGTMTDEEIRREKWSIWKNVSVISLAFMCLFTAYNSVANLQSTINSDAGLGTTAQSTVYASLIVSCMFVPTWMIKTIKCKWTLVVCQLCYSLYIAAQFHATFYTLVPAAIILGFGAAPMWSAKCTYLTQVGNRYAALNGEKSAEPSITRFFGFFFMFFQSSQIWGNLISSLVLSTGSNESGQNSTNISHVDLNVCGASFCPGTSLESLSGSKEQITLLSGILLGFALLATIIIALLVDPLTRYGELQRQGSSTGKSGFQLLAATFQHMKKPYQILIIPLTLWSGFEQAFLTAEFTQAYISCSWGVENIGYVLMCYGAADALGSILCGSVVKRIGRIPIFLFSAALNAALIIALFIWKPSPSEPASFFVIAACWGLADSVWQTQINSFYGVIFAAEEEAAFSNYRLWESLGFTIAFAYSGALCVNAKLWVLVGMLLSGMFGYLFIEFKENKKKKQSGKI